MKNANRNTKITITDIAKASGVSVSTVSRILNDKPDVAEETRERVLAVIKENHFAPQAPWQQLASGKSHIITMHYPQNPTRVHVPNDFLIGAAAACEKENYSLNFVVSPLDETSLLTLYRSGQTDGMILMEILIQDWRVELLRRNQFPFVMLGRCENNSRLSYVDLDVETGVGKAMEHLIRLGHRKIGLIAIEPYSFPEHESTNAYSYAAWTVRTYKNLCTQHGLPVIFEKIRVVKENVENGVLRLLDENPQLTAIVTTQESAVHGIIKAVQSRNLRVPEDISFVAMAGPNMAELTTPPLTTLNAQAEETGFQAARILIEQLEGHQDEEKHILIPFQLDVRGSTSSVPHKQDEK
jgi:DNA-binding LacI/PurR family transcriptional regulator